MSTPAWLARGEAHLSAGLGWLSAAESEYAERQRFSKRRSEFLIARLAAKTALARYAGLAPDAERLARIEIAHEASGAPYARVDGERSPLAVSLTDRAGWAVCLVAPGGGRWGCDLELVEPRSAGFVADWFTGAEQQYVAARRDEDARALAANLIWSAKESALKVLTTGLRRDTRSVEVRLGPPAAGWQPLTVHPEEGGEFPGWWCRFGAFVLTTAASRPGREPVALEEPPPLLSATPAHSWLADPVRAPRR